MDASLNYEPIARWIRSLTDVPDRSLLQKLIADECELVCGSDHSQLPFDGTFVGPDGFCEWLHQFRAYLAVHQPETKSNWILSSCSGALIQFEVVFDRNGIRSMPISMHVVLQ